ncbi:hypothetical protein LCGC14_3051830, partial [marine sediment metagenome]
LPEPQPETVPEEHPEKEKVPSEARRTVESLLKGDMASVSVREQVYIVLAAGIPRVAKLFGMSHQQIADEFVALVDRMVGVLRYIRAAKGSTVSRTV